MALKLQVSNSLEQLAAALCVEMKHTDLGVFQQNFIVTQTEGMNNWLRLQLADYLGIAANYKFLKPNDLVHYVYRILGGQYVQPLSAENQTWLIYTLLNEPEFEKKFPAVSRYYTRSKNVRDLKRMALAGKIADLFDQYQIYRHEMIKEWNASDVSDCGENEWQKYLWIKGKAVSGQTFPDRTTVGDFILNALKDPDKAAQLRRMMPAVHIFGISVTTRFHIEIFHHIGKVIDLSFHLLNPSPDIYWFEDRSEKQVAFLKRKGIIDQSETREGNDLLTSWGKVIQNTFFLLFNYEDLANDYEVVGSIPRQEDSLLHKIQQDIYENRMNEERPSLTIDDVKDGSITINSCFTPVREVEVLYNYLVALVDRKKERLSARDIVVMVSDIDLYAPYIKAVFRNAPYKFNFSIADESYSANDSIGSALEAILKMNEQTFKAEEVLQLLDSGYIRRRFGITDLMLIRKVVNRANIRFGFEGSTDDDSVYVSWEYGLKRIVYGLCMSGEEEYFSDADSLFPLDMVEGHSSSELVSFCYFVEQLIASIRKREERRTVHAWASYIGDVLDTFVVDPAEDPEEDLELISRQLEDYSDLNAIMTEELDYQVFSQTFLQKLKTSTRAGTFATGGITFCSLIPMRSIPFKVVGLLGLNFDKFPRKENPVNFNLMEIHKKKGDRNVKENDKHLFLETLLSAEKYLYISYVGQSVSDNTSIPPSALVDELIDYVGKKVEGKFSAGDLVTKHPLHGFSTKYNQDNPDLLNYLEGSAAEAFESNLTEVHRHAIPLRRGQGEEPETRFSELGFTDFIRFFKHPIQGFHNRVLGINYHEESVLLSNSEIFELDQLQKWELRKPVLESREEELDPFRAKLLKTGRLPLKNMSKVVLDELEKEVSGVRLLFHDLSGGRQSAVRSYELQLPTSGILLNGDLSDIYEDRLIMLCWSKNELKYHLDAYLRLLLVSALGLNLEMHYISAVKKRSYPLSLLQQQEAIERLDKLMELFRIGQERALPFWPDFGIGPKELEALDQEGYVKKVRAKIDNYNFPCTDLYILNKYREGYFSEPSTYNLFMECAEELLKPLIQVFPDEYGVR